MKRTLLSFCFCGIAMVAIGQNDTIFYLDFELDSLPSNFVETQDTADITVWQNYSLDSIPAANGRPDNWYLGPGIANVDTQNTVIASTSWLQGFLPGNRNYLISPGFYLPDNFTELSWYSASRYAPIYLDGYSVVVSTTGSAPEDFTDTLFRAAQWIGPNPNPTTTSPIAAFNNNSYSDGFVHGFDGTYLELDGDSSDWKCVLQPHSVSLAAYQGNTVRVAFVHDSDDDNIISFDISFDKIFMKGTKIIGLEERADLQTRIYPNPAAGRTHLAFELNTLGAVAWEVVDLSDRIVAEGRAGSFLPGHHEIEIPLEGLSAGRYAQVLYWRFF
ncbi:MAG: choice-of-anchor J domain-containing protein [Flavobacteriales bacterium]|nr:choice-of-anchor J domain-containing protein [Flavobacteriales bacterium]